MRVISDHQFPLQLSKQAKLKFKNIPRHLSREWKFQTLVPFEGTPLVNARRQIADTLKRGNIKPFSRIPVTLRVCRNQVGYELIHHPCSALGQQIGCSPNP